MNQYLAVWLKLSGNSFQVSLSSRISALLFLFGKILRFFFFLGFLTTLFSRTTVLAGYALWEVILIYVTFNFIDSATQMLFRDVYRIQQRIQNGQFDMVLVKPVNTLFHILFGGTDVLDAITLGPLVVVIGFVMTRLPNIDGAHIILYAILVGNALLIALAFHIFVLALAVIATEVDHAILIYRDIIGMGKIPLDIYAEPLRSVMTFFIPVGIMMTFPTKGLLGWLTVSSILMACVIGTFLFLVSILSWRYALKRYIAWSA